MRSLALAMHRYIWSHIPDQFTWLCKYIYIFLYFVFSENKMQILITNTLMYPRGNNGFKGEGHTVKTVWLRQNLHAEISKFKFVPTHRMRSLALSASSVGKASIYYLGRGHNTFNVL